MKTLVVSIECISRGSNAEEWSASTEAPPHTGDVVEEIAFERSPPARAPFKNGRAGAMKSLHSAFKRGETSVVVKAQRGTAGDLSSVVSFHACIVPHHNAGRRQYVLRSVQDSNYVVALVDRSESECIQLQGSRGSRVVCALSNAQLQDGNVAYPWEKKMRTSLSMSNSSFFLSILILPKASDESGTRYNTLEDTLARAHAWLNASQISGVPIGFMNIQTEALLTKISGDAASSTVNMGSLADVSTMANASLYGFEDYHGLDIGVVRAVRLWYNPCAGEISLEIKLKEGDTKLGFAISQTEEGFIFISSVSDEDSTDVAAARSGLCALHKNATKMSKLLVVSRVGNQKVLPWMVTTSGSIRCFDTVSISQKLSLHRHALKPILLHLLLWEKSISNTDKVTQFEPPVTTQTFIPPEVKEEAQTPATFSPPIFSPSPIDDVLEDLVYSRSDSGNSLERDSTGDVSFRFRNLSIVRNNWV